MKNTPPYAQKSEPNMVTEKVLKEVVSDAVTMQKIIWEMKLSPVQDEVIKKHEDIEAFWKKIEAKSNKNPAYGNAISDARLERMFAENGIHEKSLSGMYENAMKEVQINQSHQLGMYPKYEATRECFEFFNALLKDKQLISEEVAMLSAVTAKLTKDESANLVKLAKLKKNGMDYTAANMIYDHSATVLEERRLAFTIALVTSNKDAAAIISDAVLTGKSFDFVKTLGIGFSSGESYRIETDDNNTPLGRMYTVGENIVRLEQIATELKNNLKLNAKQKSALITEAAVLGIKDESKLKAMAGKTPDTTDWTAFSKAGYITGNVYDSTDNIYKAEGYSKQFIGSIQSLWISCLTGERRVLDLDTFHHLGIMPESDLTLDASIRLRYGDSKGIVYKGFKEITQLGDDISLLIKNKDYRGLGKRLSEYEGLGKIQYTNLQDLSRGGKYSELEKLAKVYSTVMMFLWVDMHAMGSNRLANAINNRDNLTEFNRLMTEAENIPAGARTVLDVTPAFVEPIIDSIKSIKSARDFNVLYKYLSVDERKVSSKSTNEGQRESLRTDLLNKARPIVDKLVDLQANGDIETPPLSELSENLFRFALYRPIVMNLLAPAQNKADQADIGISNYYAYPVNTDYFKRVYVADVGRVTATTKPSAASVLAQRAVESAAFQLNTAFERTYYKPTDPSANGGTTEFHFSNMAWVHDLKKGRMVSDPNLHPKTITVQPQFSSELGRVWREPYFDAVTLSSTELDLRAKDPKSFGFESVSKYTTKGFASEEMKKRGYDPAVETWSNSKTSEVIVIGKLKGKPVVMSYNPKDNWVVKHRKINTTPDVPYEFSYRCQMNRNIRFAERLVPEGPGYFASPEKTSAEVYNKVAPILEVKSISPSKYTATYAVPAIVGVALKGLESDLGLNGQLVAYQNVLTSLESLFRDAGQQGTPTWSHDLQGGWAQANNILSSTIGITLDNGKLTQRDGTALTAAQTSVLSSYRTTGVWNDNVMNTLLQTNMYRMIPSSENVQILLSTSYSFNLASIEMRRGLTLIPAWAPKDWTVIPKLSLYGIIMGDMQSTITGSINIISTNYDPTGAVIGSGTTYNNSVRRVEYTGLAGPVFKATTKSGEILGSIYGLTNTFGPSDVKAIGFSGGGQGVVNELSLRLRNPVSRPWYGYITDVGASLANGFDAQFFDIDNNRYLTLTATPADLPIGDWIFPAVPGLKGTSAVFDVQPKVIYESQIQKGEFGVIDSQKNWFGALATSLNPSSKWGVSGEIKVANTAKNKINPIGFSVEFYLGEEKDFSLSYDYRKDGGSAFTATYRFGNGKLADFDPYDWVKKTFSSDKSDKTKSKSK